MDFRTLNERHSPMTRILIADDQPLLRRGIRQILGDSSTNLDMAEACNVDELRELARLQRWDVAVIDLSMIMGHAIDLVRTLKAATPGLRIVFLARDGDAASFARLRQAGASGVLAKERLSEDLLTAVLGVAQAG